MRTDKNWSVFFSLIKLYVLRIFCPFLCTASGAVYTNEICQPSDSKNVCCKRETPAAGIWFNFSMKKKIVFLLLSPDGGG
jgi:hypothetical protein